MIMSDEGVTRPLQFIMWTETFSHHAKTFFKLFIPSLSDWKSNKIEKEREREIRMLYVSNSYDALPT